MRKIAIATLIGLTAAVMSAHAAEPSFPPASKFDKAAAAREEAAREAWRETMAHTATPSEGCFTAEYPSARWERQECSHKAITRVFLPKGGSHAMTVGNGADFAAETSGVMTQSVGTFPTVTGVTSEKDDGSNSYTLQLNSNFMSGTAACKGGASDCQSWEQFVYSTGETSAFMQYWLINYGKKCPSGGGWTSYEGSCYKNSAAVTVPQIAITSLSQMKLSGAAVAGGTDTLVFTNGTKAYSTTGKDSVADLATAWTQSEFNIVGDGGGSEASFNTSGVSITVKLATTSGSTAAPTCVSNGGTTGETNNLTLGKCSGTGGSSPYIEFTESN